ncbi:MAG: DUF4364 family protein, partial [Oscillospiraceae bacterium]
ANSEIKILICHVLCEIAMPISRDDLLDSLSGRGYANYFECADALSDLINASHITEDDHGMYLISQSGKEIAALLSEDVALTVRERVVQQALVLARRSSRQNFNKSEITKLDNGYLLRCSVSDKDSEIFALELIAPTKADAQLMRDNFTDRAEDIVSSIYTMLMDQQL